MLERNERRIEVPAKRVGLVGPIEAAGASGVVGEVVFGLLMVLQHLGGCFFCLWLLFSKCGGGGGGR